MYETWCKDHFIPEKLTVKMGNNGRQQCGRPDPHATSGRGSRARVKRASVPSSQDDDEEEISLDFL